MIDDIFRVYMSHQIRGPSGIDATDEEVQENIDRHRVIGSELRAYTIDWEKMDGFPKIDLYVPADHDEFVQIAYRKEYLVEKEILNVDCEIISRCNLVIAYGDFRKSRGMQVEIDYAGNRGIPIYHMPGMSRTAIESLKLAIRLILKSGG